jgi:hypothetical protein
VQLSRELELEMEPEYVTEFLQSHDKTFNGWGVASYGWAKKVVYWNGIFSWRGCCEHCRNGIKWFRILLKIISLSSDRVWEDWFKFWRKFYCG